MLLYQRSDSAVCVSLRVAEFRQSLERMQREEKSMRDAELAQRRGRQQRQGEIEFRCRKCDEYACMSSDIRKIENMHHVVLDLEFRERHNERPDPKADTFGEFLLGSATVAVHVVVHTSAVSIRSVSPLLPT